MSELMRRSGTIKDKPRRSLTYCSNCRKEGVLGSPELKDGCYRRRCSSCGFEQHETPKVKFNAISHTK
jgi:hypothetical protein